MQDLKVHFSRSCLATSALPLMASRQVWASDAADSRRWVRSVSCSLVVSTKELCMRCCSCLAATAASCSSSAFCKQQDCQHDVSKQTPSGTAGCEHTEELPVHAAMLWLGCSCCTLLLSFSRTSHVGDMTRVWVAKHDAVTAKLCVHQRFCRPLTSQACYKHSCLCHRNCASSWHSRCHFVLDGASRLAHQAIIYSVWLMTEHGNTSKTTQQ